MELQHFPKIYYKTTSVPNSQKHFSMEYPGGLKCTCPSNTVFYKLGNWKAHVIGKRHVSYMKTTDIKVPSEIDTEKQYKIQIGKEAQEKEQWKNKYNDLKKSVGDSKTIVITKIIVEQFQPLFDIFNDEHLNYKINEGQIINFQDFLDMLFLTMINLERK